MRRRGEKTSVFTMDLDFWQKSGNLRGEENEPNILKGVRERVSRVGHVFRGGGVWEEERILRGTRFCEREKRKKGKECRGLSRQRRVLTRLLF